MRRRSGNSTAKVHLICLENRLFCAISCKSASHVAGYVLKNDFSAEMNCTFTFDRPKRAVFSQNELHFYISWRWWWGFRGTRGSQGYPTSRAGRLQVHAAAACVRPGTARAAAVVVAAAVVLGTVSIVATVRPAFLRFIKYILHVLL